MDNTGIKEKDGKLNYELDWGFIEQMAQKMAVNKGKYPVYNWKKPISTEELKQAIVRHFIEIMKNNYSDDGRKYGHLESLALNCMMLNYQFQNSEKEFKESCLKGLVDEISNDQLLGATVRQMVK